MALPALTASDIANQNLMELINLYTQEVIPQAFEFDPLAARGVAEEGFNPYYDELLGDYLSDVGRGVNRSEQDLASQLQQGAMGRRRYTQDTGQTLRDRVEGVRGNFADRGLYGSGEQRANVREARGDTKQDRERYDADYQMRMQQQRQQQARYAKDQEIQRRRRERDLGRQREAAVTGNIETQREEQLQENLGFY